MKLTITRLESSDFGTYKCIAKNPRGQTDGSITLTGEEKSLWSINLVSATKELGMIFFSFDIPEEIPPTTTTLEPPTTPYVPTTTIATTQQPPRKRKKHGKRLNPI